MGFRFRARHCFDSSTFLQAKRSERDRESLFFLRSAIFSAPNETTRKFSCYFVRLERRRLSNARKMDSIAVSLVSHRWRKIEGLKRWRTRNQNPVSVTVEVLNILHNYFDSPTKLCSNMNFLNF